LRYLRFPLSHGGNRARKRTLMRAKDELRKQFGKA
jgi:hypothetical protein